LRATTVFPHTEFNSNITVQRLLQFSYLYFEVDMVLKPG
jgi:hypothetical protein